jgi:hypothetical protein
VPQQQQLSLFVDACVQHPILVAVLTRLATFRRSTLVLLGDLSTFHSLVAEWLRFSVSFVKILLYSSTNSHL